MRTITAALLAGLMVLAAPQGARASSLLVNGGFDSGLTGWTLENEYFSTTGRPICTGSGFALGCAPGGGGQVGGLIVVYSPPFTAPVQSTTQTFADAGPGRYEFGLWVTLGMSLPNLKDSDLTHARISLTGQTSGDSATAGRTANELTFTTVMNLGLLGTETYSDWFLLKGELVLTQTENLIFEIRLQPDGRTAGTNFLRMFFDNAYLRRVEVEEPLAAIPLPAAGWLLLGALGLLGAGAARGRRG